MSETPAWMKPQSDSAEFPPEIDTSTAHPARIWDYWLGGKDNYAADRETGEQILTALPDMVANARANRAFLARAVRHLVEEAGIRQFLDIGTGIPAADNTHEVAQSIAPECRIVYVDNDPVVLVHARALLVGTPEGATDYIDADLREPDVILSRAARTLDFDRPVAVMLLGILEFVPDTGEAAALVRRIMDAVPSGSHLVVSHSTNEVRGEAMDEAAQLWNEGGSTPLVLRSRADLAGLFEGLELVEPGVASCSQWRPDTGGAAVPEAVAQFCAVGRKP
ncbi:O-methyltransferase involved in polyketide biosynthesis [Spinactinospora alkalitolerans]|uniref:O-methyltransferase involved in polyketide biosynthesis n=1 Tax=Spinactinospora alkalitolerans TaxID=687207 RepID=A0A852U088_9ACTN|nr:SAM-dependent methyltransferase [Spinactinospora alkalitolerans]NYE48957.1 O-methyltransferase involved in polyketide biosynthesis [Spinactinospora alkalitolerans]